MPARRARTAPGVAAYLAKRWLTHPELIDAFRLGYANRTLAYPGERKIAESVLDSLINNQQAKRLFRSPRTRTAQARQPLKQKPAAEGGVLS